MSIPVRCPGQGAESRARGSEQEGDVLEPPPAGPAEVSVHGGINRSLQVAAESGTGRSGEVENGRSAHQLSAESALSKFKFSTISESDQYYLPLSQLGRGVPRPQQEKTDREKCRLEYTDGEAKTVHCFSSLGAGLGDSEASPADFAESEPPGRFHVLHNDLIISCRIGPYGCEGIGTVWQGHGPVKGTKRRMTYGRGDLHDSVSGSVQRDGVSAHQHRRG